MRLDPVQIGFGYDESLIGKKIYGVAPLVVAAGTMAGGSILSQAISSSGTEAEVDAELNLAQLTNLPAYIEQQTAQGKQDLATLVGGYNQYMQDAVNQSLGLISAGTETGTNQLLQAQDQALALLQGTYSQGMADINSFMDASLADLQPYIAGGATGVDALTGLLQDTSNPLTSQAFQYQLQENQKALNQQLSAMGLTGGGAAIQAHADLVQSLSAAEIQRAQEIQLQAANTLVGAGVQAAGIGGQLAATQASAAGSLAGQLGVAGANIYSQTGANLANLNTAAFEAASGAVETGMQGTTTFASTLTPTLAAINTQATNIGSQAFLSPITLNAASALPGFINANQGQSPILPSNTQPIPTSYEYANTYPNVSTFGGVPLPLNESPLE